MRDEGDPDGGARAAVAAARRTSRAEDAGTEQGTTTAATEVELSILVVSYGTREETLACLASVVREARGKPWEVVVVDNASPDGSAAAIEAAHGDAAERGGPPVRLVASDENLGFARGNALAAAHARGRRLLLLNPDTVVLEGALERLLAFADAHPEYAIVGGRTVFADGRLNPASCWRRPTPWSLACHATGLAAAFPDSAVLNPEAYGGWARDTVREVDAVSGCFLLVGRDTWDALGGLDPSFFVYGEELDLCLRARARGLRCAVTPDATIVHHGGASEKVPPDKVVRLLDAKRRLLERHWSPAWRPFGRAMLALWVLRRRVQWVILARLRASPRARERAATFREVWRRRAEWTRAS